jgi:hypothetical protein
MRAGVDVIVNVNEDIEKTQVFVNRESLQERWLESRGAKRHRLRRVVLQKLSVKSPLFVK